MSLNRQILDLSASASSYDGCCDTGVDPATLIALLTGQVKFCFNEIAATFGFFRHSFGHLFSPDSNCGADERQAFNFVHFANQNHRRLAAIRKPLLLEKISM